MCFVGLEGPPLLTTGGGPGDDEVLRRVLEMDLPRFPRRAISRRWFAVCAAAFPAPQLYAPPPGGMAVVELEQDRAMNKFIYSATLRLASFSANAPGPSKVSFLDWVPPYYRSVPRREGHREVVRQLASEDADATWRLACRLFKDPAAAGQGGPGRGHLRMRCGNLVEACELYGWQVEALQRLIDHRCNGRLRPCS